MIKIILLVTIIVLLVFYCFRKEPFQQNTQCPTEKDVNIFGDIILNGYGVYKNQQNQIELSWNHPSGLASDKDNIKQYVIVKNIDNDFDFINEITDDIELKDSTYKYKLTKNIESNIVYSISMISRWTNEQRNNG